MSLTTLKQKNITVSVMENHDNAYYAWKDAGVKEKILIHIDAHHDIWFIKKDGVITIANFICKALEEDIVKEVFWIVPDESWKNKKNKKQILEHLKRIVKNYPGSQNHINNQPDEISITIYEKKLRVCTLDNLPSVNENVLIDIDIDYLVIPYVTYGKFDTHNDIPWCWPNELLEKLKLKGVHSDLVTIAYSVEGGYTPLKWKYLGDELALRLKDDNESLVKPVELINKAVVLSKSGNFEMAEKIYYEARALLPNSPVPDYHLALLYLEIGQKSKAQKFYQTALAKDPSYKTAYNSLAPVYCEEKRFSEAEKENYKILELDPLDAYATYGLGLIAFKRKKWDESEQFLRKALKLNENLIDAYHLLGDILLRQRKKNEAIVTYEQCLKLSLKGYKSLDKLIVTCTKDNFLTDPDHYCIHAKLARLYASKGLTAEAINGYKISIAGGYYGFFIYTHLAVLYLKKNKIKKSVQAVLEAIKVFPSELRDTVSDFIDDMRNKK